MTEAAIYDLPQFREKYADSSVSPKMNFFVEGIKCSKCVDKIESKIKSHPELQSIRVNLPEQKLSIQLKQNTDSFAPIISEVEGLGFKLHAIKNNEQILELQKLEDKNDLRRLAVAAMSASNIMMFAFAVYFGASHEFADYFNWISFVLYLPFLFYVAIPFYKGFYYSLKEARLSVDGPLVIASVGGFIFSTINLIRGEGSVYFDSLSGFLFLILLSRFVQKRMQRNFLSFRGVNNNDSFERARILHDTQLETFSWTVAEKLKVGDEILVKRGEIIPVDGVLQSADALIDSAMLNGEAKAQSKLRGNIVLAGTVLLSGQAIIKVTAIGVNTHFGDMLNRIQDGITQKSKVQNLSDKWSQILLVTVFSLAGISILFNWSTSPEMALERALALIILACPCAMAFGTPLAIAFSMRNAFRKGFLIRNADVFQKLLKIKNVFLDKTGTLSSQHLKITHTEPRHLPNETIALLLALEKESNHPIAEAIKLHFADSAVKPAVISDYQEIIGRGVFAIYQGQKFSIESSDKVTQQKSVALFHDEVVYAQIYFADPAIGESKTLLESLKKLNLSTYILSGDTKDQVIKMADQLGVPQSNCFAEMTPQKKAEVVAKYDQSMMVGDGVNDSLAFQKAAVGISVRGSAEMALRCSDVYLMKEDISKIFDLFRIAKKSDHLIRQNLTISLIYNLIGGAGALLGYVNPFVAAVLMPISSGFILFSTWLGSRE